MSKSKKRPSQKRRVDAFFVGGYCKDAAGHCTFKYSKRPQSRDPMVTTSLVEADRWFNALRATVNLYRFNTGTGLVTLVKVGDLTAVRVELLKLTPTQLQAFNQELRRRD